MQRVQATGVGARHPEAEAAEGQLFAGFRQMADGSGDQAADGVVFVVVEIGAETRVEIGNGRERVDQILACLLYTSDAADE